MNEQITCGLLLFPGPVPGATYPIYRDICRIPERFGPVSPQFRTLSGKPGIIVL